MRGNARRRRRSRVRSGAAGGLSHRGTATESEHGKRADMAPGETWTDHGDSS
jgi:hypothetical protein